MDSLIYLALDLLVISTLAVITGGVWAIAFFGFLDFLDTYRNRDSK